MGNKRVIYSILKQVGWEHNSHITNLWKAAICLNNVVIRTCMLTQMKNEVLLVKKICKNLFNCFAQISVTYNNVYIVYTGLCSLSELETTNWYNITTPVYGRLFRQLWPIIKLYVLKYLDTSVVLSKTNRHLAALYAFISTTSTVQYKHY